jgi:hypothetical protein
LVLGAVQWLLGHRLLAPVLQRWFEGGL